MTIESETTSGFFCTMVCDRCGGEIENGEWHYHDNETGESYHKGCA